MYLILSSTTSNIWGWGRTRCTHPPTILMCHPASGRHACPRWGALRWLAGSPCSLPRCQYKALHLRHMTTFNIILTGNSDTTKIYSTIFVAVASMFVCIHTVGSMFVCIHTVCKHDESSQWTQRDSTFHSRIMSIIHRLTFTKLIYWSRYNLHVWCAQSTCRKYLIKI